MTYNTWMDKSLHSNIYFTLNMTMCWAKFSSSKANDASSDSVLKKETNQFLLLFYKNKSEKLVKTYLIPAMRSFRAQIAVNSLLSMVSSLFKSNTFKSETNVILFHISRQN